MTRISGVLVLTAPCCGAQYTAPHYQSMNFSAWESWTDGWHDWRLLPHDDSLRRCQCGRYLLASELRQTGSASESPFPRAPRVPFAQLPDCIAHAHHTRHHALEIAARRSYWQQLNHPWRDTYRQCQQAARQADEAAITAWRAANPGPAPSIHHAELAPLSLPPFQPTDSQLDNMARLIELLHRQSAGAPLSPFLVIEQAELYREQSQFDAASRILSTLPEKDVDAAARHIAQCIGLRKNAPTCYPD